MKFGQSRFLLCGNAHSMFQEKHRIKGRKAPGDFGTSQKQKTSISRYSTQEWGPRQCFLDYIFA